MLSKTFYSNQYWLGRNSLQLERYLRDCHDRKDRDFVRELMLNTPDEARKLVQTYFLSNDAKFNLILDWVITQKALTCLGLGDQRMGKDATMCYLFEMAVQKIKKLDMPLPRIVTLGNTKKPPFVKKDDMYFSILNVPSGTAENEVWIYSSEIEIQFPARETHSFESRLYSTLAGTLAQNHQKIFGLCKLASKVDLNFVRDCNMKFFKFTSPDKLNVEGIEREGVLSGLGQWLLPDNPLDQTQSLFAFNQLLLSTTNNLPVWFTSEYSEMFKDISIDKIWEYVEAVHSNGLDIHSIRIAVAQKFRKKLSIQELAEHLHIESVQSKIRY